LKTSCGIIQEIDHQFQWHVLDVKSFENAANWLVYGNHFNKLLLKLNHEICAQEHVVFLALWEFPCSQYHSR
jgi:hypothetical protein